MSIESRGDRLKRLTDRITHRKKTEALTPEQAWKDLLEKKMQEVHELPARFVKNLDPISNSGARHYITVDQHRKSPTIIFFCTYYSSKLSDSSTSAVILQEKEPVKYAVKVFNNQWIVDSDEKLVRYFRIFKKAKVFNRHAGKWKGEYPDRDNVLDAIL